MRPTLTKVMELLLDFITASTLVVAVTLITAYHIPRPEQEILKEA